jgi:putative acetyltransferase
MQKCIEKAKELGYQQFIWKVCRNSAKLFPFMKNKDFSIWKKLWEIGHSGCNLWMIKKLN